MLDDLITEILGHYNLRRNLVGQVLQAGAQIDRVPVTIYGERVELFLRRNDLYVLGYVGAGKSYCVDETPKPDINATNLGYKSAYQDLGWNRTSQPTMTMTEGEIGSALATAAAGVPLGKRQYLCLALLMEATRFVDVSEFIKQGMPFSKTRLDWQDQVEAGNARIRKASQAVSTLVA